MDVAVSTTQASHIFGLPCASNGQDLVIKFAVRSQQPQLIYADTFGTTWNTVLFFSDACNKAKPPTSTGTDAVVCSDDACGTTQSQVVAALGYGWHYLIVSGANGESGDVTVHMQSAALGNGPSVTLPQGSSAVQGTTSGTDRSGLCEASGAMDNYWWLSCPDDTGGDVKATTCYGASFDTILGLQIPRVDVLSCNDDDSTCGMQSTLFTSVPPGAGVQVLTVGGATGSGDYTLVYTRP
jgi:hypothetical protein